MEERPKKILAVNPGTRALGVAVLSGSDLQYTAMKTLKCSGLKGKVALKKMEGIICQLLEEYAPDVLAVEELLPIQKDRSPLLNRIVNRIKEIGKRENLKVVCASPITVRHFICQNEKPTKLNTAMVIATRYYPWLYRYYEKDLARKWWEDKYYTGLFDAVALALWVLTQGEN